MSRREMNDITEELKNLNAMLEICRGYTQTDAPDMKALDISLWCLTRMYKKVYEQLCSSN